MNRFLKQRIKNKLDEFFLPKTFFRRKNNGKRISGIDT